MHWSSGKDAALALYHLQQKSQHQISTLLTTISSAYDRVVMHGLRKELVQRQAAALQLPLKLITLPDEPSMAAYEETMGQAYQELRQKGTAQVAFGDIFLEDLKDYRVKQLGSFGLETVFPLWQQDTRALLREFIDLGFRAVVVSCHADLLGKDFAGREIDSSFLEDLPPTVDPCGENGEFHTFCFDGPNFTQPVAYQLGEKVYREYPAPGQDQEQDASGKKLGFWYCDLLPA